MEKPLDKLQPKSKIMIQVTPKGLREAADRLEQELKNVTLKNQVAELEFSRSVTFYCEPEPEVPYFSSISSDDPEKGVRGVGKEAALTMVN